MSEVVSRRVHSELSEQVAGLDAAIRALASDNAAMRSELDQLKGRASPSEWIALKAADRARYSYECVRSWCESGLILAEKRRGRWYVHRAGLSAHLAQLSVSKFAPER